MNWFITGPARFPVARNEKRVRISDARRADLKAFEAMARKSAKRKASRTARTMSRSDPAIRWRCSASLLASSSWRFPSTG